AADLEKARLLEMAEHEGVVTFFLGPQGVADDLRGGAKFGQRMQGGVGCIEAVDFKARVGSRDLVEQCLQAFDVGRLLHRMNEALVPDPARHAGAPPRTHEHPTAGPPPANSSVACPAAPYRPGP